MALIAGCSSIDFGRSSSSDSISYHIASPSFDDSRALFERWPVAMQLDGKAALSQRVARADEALLSGNREYACTQYQNASKGPGRDIDKLITNLSIATRLAGCKLSMGDPRSAMMILSAAARQSGQAPDLIYPPVALIFAYTFGALGDSQQAAAWFERTLSNPESKSRYTGFCYIWTQKDFARFLPEKLFKSCLIYGLITRR